MSTVLDMLYIAYCVMLQL
uniref:Uncharacterized protein n=1 Tax=Anguilla anguilla TaxID=7936 RepID=A0A0E9V6G9_ANGAN